MIVYAKKLITELTQLHDAGNELLQYVIKKHYNNIPLPVDIDKNDWGKPYISSLSEFKFNISHSGEWVVCAVSDKEVGIDIQKIVTVNPRFHNRFYSEEENEFINSIADRTEKAKAIIMLWTLKEAYIKAVGKGLAIPLNSFSTIDNNVNIKNTIDEYSLYNLHFVDSKYVLSVAEKSSDKSEINIIYIDN